MPGARLERILALFATHDDSAHNVARLCDVAATATSMNGAGFMLMSGVTSRVPVLEQRGQRAPRRLAVHSR